MDLYTYLSHNLDVHHSRTESPLQRDFEMHTHTTFQISALLDGSCIYHVEGTAYPMSPGDLIVTFPQEIHYIEICPGIPCERVSINFGPNFFNALDPEKKLHQPFTEREPGLQNHYPGTRFPQLLSQTRLLLQAGNDRFQIITQLIELLVQIQDSFMQMEYRDLRSNTLENRIMHYINRHLKADLRVEALCEKFYISRAQLYRRFIKATGATVSQYVETKRLLSARKMLLLGESPSYISQELGFQNYSTFYRAYVRYFGYSPKEELSRLPERQDEI